MKAAYPLTASSAVDNAGMYCGGGNRRRSSGPGAAKVPGHCNRHGSEKSGMEIYGHLGRAQNLFAC